MQAFINLDSGVAKEIADGFIWLYNSLCVWNVRYISHVFQDVTILHFPATRIPFLDQVPVEPDTLIAPIQAVCEDGTVCYFFGDTSIQLNETMQDDKRKLEPIAGDQAAYGEWEDLSIDQVCGYCFLLEKYLNGGENR